MILYKQYHKNPNTCIAKKLLLQSKRQKHHVGTNIPGGFRCDGQWLPLLLPDPSDTDTCTIAANPAPIPAPNFANATLATTSKITPNVKHIYLLLKLLNYSCINILNHKIHYIQ